MILIEITLNTSEIATWLIGAVITAMCVLLYDLLRSLKKGQEKHTDMLSEHGQTLSAHEERLNAHEKQINFE